MNQVSAAIKTINESKLVLSNWSFKQVDEQAWMPANVPGFVHTDLLKNSMIPDPYYGKNELDLQWIDKKDWEYETTFDIPEELYKNNQLVLVFNGLDTYADVYLNDQHILEADNMFRSWKTDVKSMLQKDNNRLRIHFHSPINRDLLKLEKQGYPLPAVNDHSKDGGIGDKKVSVFARKAPYHYGWDWGPRFVTSGIWKEAEIIGWTDTRIIDLFIHQKKVSSASADLTAILEIESESEYKGMLTFSTEELKINEEIEIVKGLNRIELDVELTNPKLWWSRGLGDQHLYIFSASLMKDEKLVAEKSVRTGIRSMKLIREKDQNGKSFYMELNGVPVFAKGANHIPNDSFVTNVTYDRYKHEILSAVESNMNMLRVWGGGIYENDEFYDLCDEYGILVWQDFMFACSMYPGDEAFLQNVKIEAEENVKRLRNHPSLALWCGNNEMDVAWSEYKEDSGWGWKEEYTREVRQEIWNAYEAIFHQILPEAVQKFSPGEDYWPSSPMSDWTGEKDQHSFYTSASGDIHYWDVWHGLKPFEEYNSHVGRFMSEYGFQSFPEFKTVKTYAAEEEMELESPVMLHHQKNDRGNYLINDYMKKYLPEPKDFQSFLYMSQVLQAEGIKMAIEAHRRKKPYCMGTLYWQMNDCWPVASWASMDYYGRWKALHYYARKSFKDVALSIDGTNPQMMDITVISDNLNPVKGFINLKLLTFRGELLKEIRTKISVEANTCKSVLSFQADELIKGLDAKDCVLVAQLEQNGEIYDSKEHYFVSCKEMELSVPTITVMEVNRSGGSEFILNTDILAKQVWIAAESEGIFTDNYFDLIPDHPVKIQFLSSNSESKGFSPAVPGKIEIKSMADFIKK
ncbi:MAG: beta-mannosidase [Bacillota bacterium]